MPLPLIPIAIGMTAAAGGLSIFGGLFGSGEKQKRAEYNAQLAENEAIQAKYQAEFATYQANVRKELAKQEVARKGAEIKSKVASQKVSAAKRGVAGSVSPAEVQLETMVQGAVDQEMIKWRGDVEFLEGQHQARQFEYQSTLKKQEATWIRRSKSQERTASWLNAGATLLSTGSKALSIYAGRTKPPSGRTT